MQKRQIPEWASVNLSSDWMWSPNSENKLQIAVTVHENQMNRHAGSELSRLLWREQVRPVGQTGYPISLVASLDTVPVKCCVPLLVVNSWKLKKKKFPGLRQYRQPLENEMTPATGRSFASIQMVHTHTPPQWGIFLLSREVRVRKWEDRWATD